ncbi:MrpH family fimbial adhesin [Pseudomonas chlororaphis]
MIMFMLTAYHLLQSATGSPMPVLLGIESELSSDGRQIIYHLTHGVVEVGAFGDAPMHPGQLVAFAAQRFWQNQEYNYILGNSGASSGSSNTETKSSIYMRSYDRAKEVTTITRPARDPYHCFGYMYFLNGNTDTGTCIRPPPPNQSCKFSTGELLLDHGAVNMRAVNGHATFAVADVSCTSEVSVKFIMPTGLDYVALQPHGRSVLRVNGQELGATIYLSSGMSLIIVSDQIEGVTEAGWFSGSAVLAIEIM